MSKLKANQRRQMLFPMIFLSVAAIITFSPVLLMILSSFTDEQVLLENGYSFFPKAFSLQAYQVLFSQTSSIFNSYKVSTLVTVIGTTINVILTVTFAYPLSRRNFTYRNFFSFFVFFTMLFNGGIVPSYILWSRYMGVRNTICALIFPAYLLSAFNVILVKNFYKHNIPEALMEAAEIDGASEWTVFFRIVLPLAKPVVTTVALFAGITYWNDWVNGLYYINKKSLFSIQQLLTQILNNVQFLNSGRSSAIMGHNFVMPSVSYRMSIAVVGILPILIVTPLLQEQLVRGLVIGAVKG